MTTVNAVLDKLEIYSQRVSSTTEEFRRRLAALEAPETREAQDAVMSIGSRARLSATARDDLRDFICQAGSQEYLHHWLKVRAAAMTSGSDPDGGYTVLPEIDFAIRALSREISPMRSVCTVREISGDSLRLTVEAGNLPTANWVGETESRPSTVGSSFGQIDIPACEAYACPLISQSLIDDSSFDIVDFVVGKIAMSLNTLEGSAFVSGNGIKKPKGVTTYPLSTLDDNTRDSGSFQYFPTGAGGAPTSAQLASALVSASDSLRAEFSGRAVWGMTKKTRAAIRTMTYSGSDSRLLWSPSGGGSTGYSDARPDELLGSKIVLMPDLAELSVANGISILYGDFSSAYTIVDRRNITLQKDPFTTKGFVGFYVTKRTGGGASGGDGFKALKFVRNSST
jgi:HK97 family phage major capsid protein